MKSPLMISFVILFITTLLLTVFGVQSFNNSVRLPTPSPTLKSTLEPSPTLYPTPNKVTIRVSPTPNSLRSLIKFLPIKSTTIPTSPASTTPTQTIQPSTAPTNKPIQPTINPEPTTAITPTPAQQIAEAKCYLGMSLPADTKIFSNNSPWRTEIGGSPNIQERSKEMIDRLGKTVENLQGSFTKWTYPIHVIDSRNCPLVKVYLTNEGNTDNDPNEDQIVEDIPIPTEAWPDPTADGHMIVVDPRLNIAWELSRASQRADKNWQASRVQRWDLNGPGYIGTPWRDWWWTYGANGAGTPLLAGLIRPEELSAGEINHALIFAGPTNRKNLTGSSFPQFCQPVASRSDGGSSSPDSLPEGVRLQLDPTLDLNQLGLSREGKIIARALQKYGMYDTDNSPTFKIYFQNLGQNNPWMINTLQEDLARIPIKSFRALDCNLVSR